MPEVAVKTTLQMPIRENEILKILTDLRGVSRFRAELEFCPRGCGLRRAAIAAGPAGRQAQALVSVSTET